MVQLWCVTQILHPSRLTSELQIPQLWSSGLGTSRGNEVLTRRVASIAERELEKELEDIQKVEDRNALAQAKLESKEAYAAVKARIQQERAAAAEAKKVEKLRLEAERKAEKARVAADSKARRGGRKVRSPLVVTLRLLNNWCL